MRRSRYDASRNRYGVRWGGLCAHPMEGTAVEVRLEQAPAAGAERANADRDAGADPHTRAAQGAPWTAFRPFGGRAADTSSAITSSGWSRAGSQARRDARGRARATETLIIRLAQSGTSHRTGPDGQARLVFCSSLGECAMLNTAWIGVASRHAGPAFPASTSSLVQHGNAAMLKPPRRGYLTTSTLVS